MSSKYKCPVCKQPLRLVRDNGNYLIWCGYGPCLSQAANNGMKGETEEEAFENLVARIKDE